MKVNFLQLISRLLLVSMLSFSVEQAQAGMIATDQMLAASESSQQDREKVRNFLARADVASQLQGLGLSAGSAKNRVDALTDEEVQKIAGKIDTLPAGAISGWAVGGLLILIGIIWYLSVKK